MYPTKITYVLKTGDNLYRLASRFCTTVPSILSLNKNADPYRLSAGTTLIVRPYGDFDLQAFNSALGSVDFEKEIELIDDMRTAWAQHVYWSRMALISIAHRLGDQSTTEVKLMRNPKVIADVFARYYSPNDAKNIEQLITEHLQIAGNLITALRDGKTADADNLERIWYQNADKIAQAIAAINPYYDRDILRKMLRYHLDLLSEEISMRLAGNYPEDVTAFDNSELEASAMADYFSSGIMRQFPDKFKLQ